MRCALHTEVDAALDTESVGHIAEYLAQEVASNPHAQYVVVTHRPEMYARSEQVLGVYTLDTGATRVVSFEPRKEGNTSMNRK